MACIFCDKPCMFFRNAKRFSNIPPRGGNRPVSDAYMPDIFTMSPRAHPLAAYQLFHTPVGCLHSPGIYTKNPYTSYL